MSLKYIDLGYCSFDKLKDSHNLKHFDDFLTKIRRSPDWETIYRNYQRAPTKDADSDEKMKFLGFDPVQTEMFHI